MSIQKSTKCKRLTGLLLALIMLVGLLPLSAVPASAAGSVTGNGTAAHPYVVTDYDGLRDVLMNRGSSQTTYLKLGADFDTKSKADGAGVTEATKIQIRNFFVLDLNGHKAELYSLKINHLIRIIYGGLTVWDSSPGRTGELQGSGDVDYFILLDYGHGFCKFDRLSLAVCHSHDKDRPGKGNGQRRLIEYRNEGALLQYGERLRIRAAGLRPVYR